MNIKLKYLIKGIIFCTFLFISFSSYAQDTIPKSEVEIERDLLLPDSLETNEMEEEKEEEIKLVLDTEVSADTIVHYGFLSGIEIGIDYLKLSSLLNKNETKYEGFLGILFKNKFVLVLEAGTAELDPPSAFKNGKYNSKGTYGRVGINYLLSFNDKSLLITGLRYGASTFSEIASFEVTNVFEFTQEYRYSTNDRRAKWYEIVLGSETNIRKNIIAGGILRFRILGSVDKDGPFEPHSIPGYGRAFDRTIPALNLFVKYRLNF